VILGAVASARSPGRGGDRGKHSTSEALGMCWEELLTSPSTSIKTELSVFIGIIGRLQVHRVWAPIPPQLGSPTAANERPKLRNFAPIPPQGVPFRRAALWKTRGYRSAAANPKDRHHSGAPGTKPPRRGSIPPHRPRGVPFRRTATQTGVPFRRRTPSRVRKPSISSAAKLGLSA
jgi:hypothetical protein